MNTSLHTLEPKYLENQKENMKENNLKTQRSRSCAGNPHRLNLFYRENQVEQLFGFLKRIWKGS